MSENIRGVGKLERASVRANAQRLIFVEHPLRGDLAALRVMGRPVSHASGDLKSRPPAAGMLKPCATIRRTPRLRDAGSGWSRLAVGNWLFLASAC
jgi:hypothetical protein